MLTFVGLGLFDHRDISVKGLECIRQADAVFIERYTSMLAGTTLEEMERFYGKRVELLAREEVEQDPERLLACAAGQDVVFLTGGDPMVSTTHMDLRLRAHERGIRTAIIHGASISSAVCGLTGLQNYRFGKSCSLPFPAKNWFPHTPIEVVAKNLSLDLHTLVYLDIQKDRYMTVSQAVGLMEELAEIKGFPIPLYVGVARAGSDHPVVAAGSGEKMRNIDLGPPLHILVVPARLHVVEQEYLEAFAGL
ncbi:diphthine synthase [Methanolinea mesophila]|uniref:diphthine synthase n=1 Tax=Methanolinea mesophila TaxID=547055 RepID=UPI001AEA7632|nr:diphthine synthase [Methanolinea mesophila]